MKLTGFTGNGKTADRDLFHGHPTANERSVSTGSPIWSAQTFSARSQFILHSATSQASWQGGPYVFRQYSKVIIPFVGGCIAFCWAGWRMANQYTPATMPMARISQIRIHPRPLFSFFSQYATAVFFHTGHKPVKICPANRAGCVPYHGTAS